MPSLTREAGLERLDHDYTTLDVLSISNRAKVELVKSTRLGTLAVKKTIFGKNDTYARLTGVIDQRIIRIYGCIQEQGNTIVLEEFVNGQTLEQTLAQAARPPEQQVVQWALQICQGLKLLHGRQVVHRDLKPSNIMIDQDNRIKLIDFDCARLFDDQKSKDTVYLGTKGYASPEQYGFAQTDFRSDIFSLGVLINRLLTGGMMEQGVYATEPLGAVIAKCTQIDPEQRYQTIEEVIAALERKNPPENAMRLTKAPEKTAHPGSPPGRLEDFFTPVNASKIAFIVFVFAVSIYDLFGQGHPASKVIATAFVYFYFVVPTLAYAVNLFQIRKSPPISGLKNHRFLFGVVYAAFWLVGALLLFAALPSLMIK